MTKMIFFCVKKYGKMIRGKWRHVRGNWRHVRGKQVTLHFKRCGLKKYGKMKCLMTSMSGIELCHALTIVFYNANSHLVVNRLKYLGFQYYHEWNYGSIYARQVWRCQRGYQSRTYSTMEKNHCSESKHRNIIVMAYEVRILIILLYFQN